MNPPTQHGRGYNKPLPDNNEDENIGYTRLKCRVNKMKCLQKSDRIVCLSDF